jgi:hypothetical protein
MASLPLNTVYNIIYNTRKSVFLPIIVLMAPSRLPRPQNNWTICRWETKSILMTFLFNTSASYDTAHITGSPKNSELSENIEHVTTACNNIHLYPLGLVMQIRIALILLITWTFYVSTAFVSINKNYIFWKKYACKTIVFISLKVT